MLKLAYRLAFLCFHASIVESNSFKRWSFVFQHFKENKRLSYNLSFLVNVLKNELKTFVKIFNQKEFVFNLKKL